MASEISHRHTDTGSTLYATIRNISRQMWSTASSDWEALTVANWGDYDIALSETPASSYLYVGTFPPVAGNMVAGWYWVDVFEQVGGSPAIGDTLIASYWGYWDGTTYKWWGDDAIQVEGSDATNQIRDAILSDATRFPGASITEARLVELDAANMPGDIDGVAAAVAGLGGAAMRGTDGANTVVPDVAGTAAALISALNNLSSAEAQSAAAAALTAYDPPTNTQMEARTLPAANYATSTAIADVKTDTGNLVARITANLFSGITYMKNWLALIMGSTSDATTLAEVNATTAGASYANTSMALEAIDTESLTAQQIRDAMKLAPTAGDPAAGSVDKHLDDILEDTVAIQASLTQATITATSAIAGGTAYITRGTTWVANFSGLGDISDRTKLWFAVKRDAAEDVDTEAIVQIEETDGLIRIQGNAPTSSANGTVVVSDESTGALTVTIKPGDSYKLLVATGYTYDLKVLRSTGVIDRLTYGDAEIIADVTRAVS